MSVDSTGNEAETSGSQPIGLTEAFSVQSSDDNRALYAKWADTNEFDFTVPRRCIYPRTAAELLCERFSDSGRCSMLAVALRLRARNSDYLVSLWSTVLTFRWKCWPIGDYLDDRTTIKFAELLSEVRGGFQPPP